MRSRLEALERARGEILPTHELALGRMQKRRTKILNEAACAVDLSTEMSVLEESANSRQKAQLSSSRFSESQAPG